MKNNWIPKYLNSGKITKRDWTNNSYDSVDDIYAFINTNPGMHVFVGNQSIPVNNRTYWSSIPLSGPTVWGNSNNKQPFVDNDLKVFKDMYGRDFDTLGDVEEENERLNNDIQYRYQVKSSMFPPKYIDYGIPADHSKGITLSNAGSLTGAYVTTNMLDSIYNDALRADLDFWTGLGVAAKESTMGNPTDDPNQQIKLSRALAREYAKSPWPVELHLAGPWTQGWNQTDVVNFYKFINPYQNTYEYVKGDPEKLAMSEKADDRKAEKLRNLPAKSILQAAFELYRNHPEQYNPKQENYQLLVLKKANEAKGSPEILKWLKERNNE